jgi:hypothetical protein
LSSAGQQAGREIAGQLTALARSDASGALKVTGHPGGVIHLADGYLALCTYAVRGYTGAPGDMERELG